MYKNHLILQFDCTNTLEEAVLENVSVVLKEPDGFNQLKSVDCSTLKYNVPGRAYILYEINVDALSDLTGQFENVILKYKVRDCDPTTGLINEAGDSYEDEYPLEDFEMAVADYMQRVSKTNFQSTWDDLGIDNEIVETYSLSAFNNLEEAMKNVICFMGMQPCERTDKLQHGKQSTHHSLKLAGLFRGEEEVLVQIRLAIDVYNPEAGVTMQLAIRCQDKDIAEFIAATIQ
jgi:coatomer protein complex subunit gamma